MPRLLFSVPLSPWHEMFCAIGVQRSFAGTARLVGEVDGYATRLIWFAGVAVGFIHPNT